MITLVKKTYRPTKERRQVDKTLNSLAEALPLVSSMIRCRATLCAPAGSDIHYAKSRRESNSTSKNLSAIETIDSFIQRSKEISSPPVRTKTVPKRKTTKKVKIVSPDKANSLPDPPCPSNGESFTIEEAVTAFHSYKHKSQKKLLIDYWYSNKWIPQKYDISTWYKLAKKYVKERKPGKRARGPKPFVTVTEIEEMAQNRRGENRTDGSDEIQNFVQETQKKKKFEQGLYFTECKPSKKTLARIKTVITDIVSSEITDKAIAKTEARIAAESSIRSTASFLITTAMTMYQIGEVQPETKNIGEATEGAQKFYKLISSYYGGVVVRPLPTSHIASTDDTTLVWDLHASDSSQYEWRIAYGVSKNNGIHSKFTPTKTSAAMPVRARLTVSAAADGTMCPTYVTITGLNERELPESAAPDGILVVPIKAFCIGGGNLNPDHPQVGCIVFLKKGKDIETANFEYYRQKIFIPWLETKREKQDGVPIAEDDRIFSGRMVVVHN